MNGAQVAYGGLRLMDGGDVNTVSNVVAPNVEKKARP